MDQPEPMTWRAAVLQQGATADTAMRRALLAGDEAAFAHYASSRYASLQRVAGCGVDPHQVPVVIQEALRDFCAALDSHASHPSLDGLLFRCLVQRVRRHARALAAPDPFAADEPRAPCVPREQFRGDGDRWSGGWLDPPRPFALESAAPATLAQVHRALGEALDRLAPRLRVVAILRDVEGLGLQEIGEILEISDARLRDALNRARARLRAALDLHLSPRARAQEART